MGRHFLDLDAGLVRTQDYALCQRAVADVIAAGAMGVIHGQAGTGKTFAFEDAVAASGEAALFLGFASRPTMRGMAEELCMRLFDFDPGRTDMKSLTRLLRAHLDVDPVAQKFNRKAGLPLPGSAERVCYSGRSETRIGAAIAHNHTPGPLFHRPGLE